MAGLLLLLLQAAVACASDICSLPSNRCTYTKLLNCTLEQWPQHCIKRIRGSLRATSIYHLELRTVRVQDVHSWLAWLQLYGSLRGGAVQHSFVAVDVQSLLDSLNTSLPLRSLQELRLQNMHLSESWFCGAALSLLVSVAKVQLSQCGLRRPPRLNVSDLRELDLSGNLLSTVQRSSFDSVPLQWLYALDLRSNLICYVEVGTFSAMLALQSLDLSDNPLVTLTLSFYLLNRLDPDSVDSSCQFTVLASYWVQDCCLRPTTVVTTVTTTVTMVTTVTSGRQSTVVSTESMHTTSDADPAPLWQVSEPDTSGYQAGLPTGNLVVLGVIGTIALLLTVLLGVLLHRCRRDRRLASASGNTTTVVTTAAGNHNHHQNSASDKRTDTRNDGEGEQLLRLVLMDVQTPAKRPVTQSV